MTYGGGWYGYGYQDPYGQQGYYGPPRQGNQGSAIGAAVANGITMACCCFPGGAIGLVLSILALTKINTDPDSADNFGKWAWITFGVSLALGIVVWVLFIARRRNHARPVRRLLSRARRSGELKGAWPTLT